MPAHSWSSLYWWANWWVRPTITAHGSRPNSTNGQPTLMVENSSSAFAWLDSVGATAKVELIGWLIDWLSEKRHTPGYHHACDAHVLTVSVRVEKASRYDHFWNQKLEITASQNHIYAIFWLFSQNIRLTALRLRLVLRLIMVQKVVIF